MSDVGARTPILAANWKMYHGPTSARTFLERFLVRYGPRVDRTVIFFPPAISITAFLEARGVRSDLEVGVQDVHAEIQGAHTGAVSAAMAAEAGAAWGLAGHSERRREFGDDDGVVASKLGRLLEAGLRPILCVGETLEERRAGSLEEVLRRQVRAAVEGLEASGAAPWEHRVLAYEPVWAIGTGETATPRDATEAHGLVREALERFSGDGTAAVLYGGSVKPENIDELLAAEGVDGVLVGGASLDPESFARICLSET